MKKIAHLRWWRWRCRVSRERRHRIKMHGGTHCIRTNAAQYKRFLGSGQAWETATSRYKVREKAQIELVQGCWWIWWLKYWSVLSTGVLSKIRWIGVLSKQVSISLSSSSRTSLQVRYLWRSCPRWSSDVSDWGHRVSAVGRRNSKSLGMQRQLLQEKRSSRYRESCWTLKCVILEQDLSRIRRHRLL